MASPTLAGPPGPCCAKTVQHTGTPTGSVITIADLPTYAAYPPEGATGIYSKILVYFADVFGPMYVNSQLLADFFASEGFLVLAPDYLEGDPIQNHFNDPGFNFQSWGEAWVAPKFIRAKEIVPPWLDAMKAQFGNPETQYFVVGYCFGGPFTCDTIALDWLSAGAMAHPGMLNEDNFRNAKKPLLVSGAAGDHRFPLESRFKMEQILLETKLPYHLQIFSTVAHGYALRGNMENPEERWAKEECANTIVRWFQRWTV